MAPIKPSATPKVVEPKYGFNATAEQLNGRAAMAGFTLLLAIEFFTGSGFLTWIGVN